MKFQRQFLLILLVVLMGVLVSGCSGSTANKSAQEKFKFTSDEHKPYIGFLIDTLKDERWYKDKALFEGQVKSLGGQVKTLAANGLDDVQIKQAELLIAEGVDVLVVVPHNAKISAKIVDIAHKAGVKVISYDRLISDAKVDYYVSFDNVKVGELQATEILKNVSNGNFAYIGGAQTDNNAILFRQGAMKVLQPLIDQGKIKLVYDQYTDEWKPEVAKQNMLSALKKTGNKINAVIAANDGTAGGVIDALTTAHLAGSVPVSGQDAELAAIRRILKGTQTMTVYKPINQLAMKAAEMAMKVAKGEKVQTNMMINNGKADIPSVFLEPVVITKNNIRDTVIKDGFLTEQEVFQ